MLIFTDKALSLGVKPHVPRGRSLPGDRGHRHGPTHPQCQFLRQDDLQSANTAAKPGIGSLPFSFSSQGLHNLANKSRCDLALSHASVDLALHHSWTGSEMMVCVFWEHKVYLRTRRDLFQVNLSNSLIK